MINGNETQFQTQPETVFCPSEQLLKMVIFEVVEWEWLAFKKLETDYQAVCTEDILTLDNAADYSDADIISTFVHSELSAAVLQHFPNLQLIVTRAPSYNRIDREYCQQRKIGICNVQPYLPLL
jgi:D-lactate dehydrogenase